MHFCLDDARLAVWNAQPSPVMSVLRNGPWWPPYLTLMPEAALQCEHRVREVCNGLRWLVRAGQCGG
jgi:hypothetical protein